MLSLKIASNKFESWMRNTLQIKLDDLLRIGGRGVANYLRQWFFDLDAKRPNQMGGKRTHFFAQIARAVQQPRITADAAIIDIRHVGLAQRWLGGTIRAGQGTSSATGGPTKYLAIPARTEAYGRTPAEFHDLSFVPPGKGHPGMLVQNLQSEVSFGRKRKDGTRAVKAGGEIGGLALFWLVKEVNQKADPSVMPQDQQLAEALNLSITEYLRIKMQPKE